MERPSPGARTVGPLGPQAVRLLWHLWRLQWVEAVGVAWRAVVVADGQKWAGGRACCDGLPLRTAHPPNKGAATRLYAAAVLRPKPHPPSHGTDPASPLGRRGPQEVPPAPRLKASPGFRRGRVLMTFLSWSKATVGEGGAGPWEQKH